jgi:MYXO-CTERM domain-containing protein
MDTRKRLGNWSLYAAAAGATIAMAANADADIIHNSDPTLDLTVTGVPNSPNSKSFSIDGQTLSAFVDRLSTLGFRVNVAGIWNPSGDVKIASVNTGGLFFDKKYNLGQSILFTGIYGGGTMQKSSNNGVLGQWGPGVVTGFLGIELPGTHYGWIQVRLSNDGDLPNKLEVLDWAYNSVAGQAIRAGDYTPAQLPTDTPEPGTMGLAVLALGAAGLTAWRKRRDAVKTAEAAA